MRIAICDDCQEDIKYLKHLISECEVCPTDVEFYEYSSGEKLLEDFMKFHLIFLDIKLGGISGVRTGESIRLQDSEVVIVFYTNYDISASKVAKTRPFHYLIKETDIKEHKAIILNALLKVISQAELPNLSVEYHGDTLILPLSEILYMSILDRGTAIWLRKESRHEYFGNQKQKQEPLEQTIKSKVKLETYYEQLKNYGFIYAKKSYIVNARFIVGRYKDALLLKGGIELSVARSRKKHFDDQLAKYWENNTIGGNDR